MRRLILVFSGALYCASLGQLVLGAEPPDLAEVQITATRVAENVDFVPASLAVVRGEDLRRLGATDLRSALASIAGLDAPPGGDAGPAGSVPSFWGLHEFDAFLLVVDGVPWGGAFNPALPALDLNDVKRIEVVKGAAPVMFGATSFVGVIHVMRYPAGESDQAVSVAGGSRSSAAGSVSTALPAIGSLRQSVLLDADRTRFTGRDQGYERGHALYRGAAPLLDGNGGVDLEYLAQTQLPASPVVRSGGSLTALTPLDGNFNPADAGIVEHRSHLVLNYTRALASAEWRTLASYSYERTHDVRGFLRRELSIGADGANADGFNQDRTVRDLYLDSFVAVPLTRRVRLTAGADWLFGDATQQSRNFAYLAALDGSAVPPPSGTRHIDEINAIADKRKFGGLYVQLDWKASDRLGVLGGLRLNDTREEQLSTHLDTTDSTNNGYFPDTRHDVRLSGDLGGTFRLWGEARGAEHGILFAQYSNNFKPAAIDFGPDVSERILKPENAGGYQGGLRVKSLDGALECELAAFRLDFANLVVSQTGASGTPVLVNAGSERFEGAEGELRWRLTPGTKLTASYSYHDTRFGNTLSLESGTLVQLDGHQLNLSPHNLAALGVQLAAPQGLEFASQVAYVGRRFLDRLNTAPVGGYLTLDARVGVRLGQFTVAVQGENLTDRRDPVTASEFGDQSYYLMPARQVMLSVTTDLGKK
jgi:outer membrane receptor protein involved in Fe transport